MVTLGALRTGSWRKHLVVDTHGLTSPLIPDAIIVCGNQPQYWIVIARL